MGLLGYFSQASQQENAVVTSPNDDGKPIEAVVPVVEPTSAPPPAEVGSSQPAPAPTPADVPLPLSPVTSQTSEAGPKHDGRRFSFRTFSFTPAAHNKHKYTLSSVEEHQKKEKAHAALSKRLAKPMSRSEKRAEESALLVRTLIVGPSKASPSVSAITAKPQMSKLKSQLLKPKSANKVINHLRNLPVADDVHPEHTHPRGKGCSPIHAVCLEHTDVEEHDMHFAKLSSSSKDEASASESTFGIAQFASAPVDKLTELLSEVRVVDFIATPDFGLGQPGDGKGILAGAVPTAETVLNGIQQITPQLMALGYATGQAIFPDHAGIYPPTDRMSVLTYWWGLEILLPPSSIAYLNSVHSISGTVVNFLSALAMIHNGVREILPFVRYIAQFIDFEFNNIKGQDKGKGVICAATWVMPAALVPRPWDFPPPPPASSPDPAPVPVPSTGEQETPAEESQSKGAVEKPDNANTQPVTKPETPVSPSLPSTPAPVQPPASTPSEKAPVDVTLPIPVSIPAIPVS
ncbi:hypothetical protein VNI00_007402 [Paramarasmius palmivorus]|uniref:Uncharacterized protein n=1 Tax=Paramarasmius palmivorus TaxID=297713 RepID=A0AAW0D241_9AGAR